MGARGGEGTRAPDDDDAVHPAVHAAEDGDRAGVQAAALAARDGEDPARHGHPAAGRQMKAQAQQYAMQVEMQQQMAKAYGSAFNPGATPAVEKKAGTTPPKKTK